MRADFVVGGISALLGLGCGVLLGAPAWAITLGVILGLVAGEVVSTTGRRR